LTEEAYNISLRYLNIILLSFVFFNACKEKPKSPSIQKTETTSPSLADDPSTKNENSEDIKNPNPINGVNEVKEKSVVPDKKDITASVDNKDDFKQIPSSSGIAIDIKYATKDNFTKKQIYPCGKCYLRPDAAQAIEKAHKILQSKHQYGLKMFDCYRPRPAQQRLWDVVPNADYVTPPAKGSMHNRGLAVDLTIVDAKGKDLDMGTPYDFFGKEAHTDNLDLPANVLTNRQLLASVMKEVGFSGIRTEWWHFSFDSSAALSDWEWPCK
jgi:zinc D-Ala-D-Ala dipeptidase